MISSWHIMPPKTTLSPLEPGPGPENPEGWIVGDRVEANYKDRNHWYFSKVIARHDDGTYDIEYAGENQKVLFEQKLSAIRIRSLPPALLKGISMLESFRIHAAGP